MRVTLDGAGVVLAFVIAGAGIGSWSAAMTWQLATLRKEVCRLREQVNRLVAALPV